MKLALLVEGSIGAFLSKVVAESVSLTSGRFDWRKLQEKQEVSFIVFIMMFPNVD